MTTQEKLDIIVKSCEDKKGIDIKVLDIKGMTSIADYFVIVSGNSSTQVDALAREIDEKLSEKGEGPQNDRSKSVGYKKRNLIPKARDRNYYTNPFMQLG